MKEGAKMSRAGEKFEVIKEKLLKEEEFKYEYEKLKPRYEVISQIIEARSEQNITQEELAQKIYEENKVVISYDGNNVFSAVIPNKDSDYLFTAITLDGKNNFGISSSTLVTGVKSTDPVVTNPNTVDYKYILFVIPVIILVSLGILNKSKFIRKDQYERY